MPIKKSTPIKKSAAEECCAKCEKDITALKKELAASNKQCGDLALLVGKLEKRLAAVEAKPEAEAKDPRVDRLISVLRNSIPKFQKKWSS